MKAVYLPDTNVIIRALQGREPDASFLRKQIEKNAIVLSVIVIAEFYGKADLPKEEERAFTLLLKTFPVIPIDGICAKIAGEYRRKFSLKIKKTYLSDCFLAAQAKIHTLTLVTNNKADFPMRDIKIITPSYSKN